MIDVCLGSCEMWEFRVGSGGRRTDVVRGEFDVLLIVVRWNVERDIFIPV